MNGDNKGNGTTDAQEETAADQEWDRKRDERDKK